MGRYMEASVLVLAGVMPTDLLAFERAELYDIENSGKNTTEARAEIKAVTLNK